jgi:hypothetical protein
MRVLQVCKRAYMSVNIFLHKFNTDIKNTKSDAGFEIVEEVEIKILTTKKRWKNEVFDFYSYNCV